jgi:hypothetical protein
MMAPAMIATAVWNIRKGRFNRSEIGGRRPFAGQREGGECQAREVVGLEERPAATVECGIDPFGERAGRWHGKRGGGGGGGGEERDRSWSRSSSARRTQVEVSRVLQPV